MQIRTADAADIGSVMQLLTDSRDWQAEQGFEAWSQFDRAQIERDILAGQVYLGIVGSSARGTMTLVDGDALAWGADERGDALYLHRLASARTGPRQGVGAQLIRWARAEAARRGRKWLRLETWDTNTRMRGYYEQQGFRHVRDQYFPPDSPLPDDYRGTRKSLYQLEV